MGATWLRRPIGCLSCGSLSAKSLLIVRLVCGNWPMKMRHPMGFCHPVNADFWEFLLFCVFAGTDKILRDGMRVRVLTSDAQQVTRCVLQCVAVCCSVLQRGAAWCSVLQCVQCGCEFLHCSLAPNRSLTVCCSVFQRVAVCCSVLQCGCEFVCCSLTPNRSLTVCFSVLQCVAVCCSVLQCVAVCCSVLQCVAVWLRVRCSVDASPCIALWRPACHLLCVTGCCSVLQFVEVFTERCSVLQCVAVYGLSPPYMRMVLFMYREREEFFAFASHDCEINNMSRTVRMICHEL